MVLIEWRDDFALGIPDVDHEHRELVAIINDLHEALVRRGTRDAVPDFLGDLHARISAHFALEEKVMRDRGYDALAGHKADHDRLLEEIRDLMDAWEDGEVTDLDAFAQRLDAWFSEHFRTHDARLHRLVNGDW